MQKTVIMVALVATTITWGSLAQAQDLLPKKSPIVTDRPDFTESSVTVGYGVVQLETGYRYTYDSDSDGSIRNHSFPESLLRVGMFKEVRAVEVGESVAVGREMRRHPVENYADTVLVQVVYQIHEVLRRAVARGWREVPRRLVAP